MKTIISFVLLLFMMISCGQKKVDTKAEGEKLMQLSREWSQNVPTKDNEKILSYWADDAVVFSPGESTKGKDALRTMVEAGSKDPNFSISWEPLEAQVSDDGSMAYLIEQNKVTINDSTIFYNNVVTVWRKIDGTWKNVVDIGTPKPAEK